MKKSFKKLLLLMAVVVTAVVSFAFTTGAITYNGIANNGTDGIYIDIYSEPYTSMAKVPTYGKYAYGLSGCAWFATSRTKQLTGKNISTIYSGYKWYHEVYDDFGFTRGKNIRAKALACYENHVAVVEKVNGNTVTISEGGNRDHAYNDYCIIRQKTIAQVESADFYGYVYIGEGENINPPTASKVDLGTNFYAAIFNTERNKALTVETNNNIAIYTYTGATNQIWYFTKNNDGSYRIKSCCNGESIDVCGGSSASWVDVVTWTSNDTGAQKWSFYGNSPYMFISPECNSGVLDVADAKYDDGTNISINVKTGHNAQLFNVVKVDAPAIGEMRFPFTTFDKSKYYVGDEICFSWEKTDSNTDFYQYWVVIQNLTTEKTCYSGATGDAGDVSANTFSFIADKEGNYEISVYAVPYNNKGERQEVHRNLITVSQKHSHSYFSSIVKASTCTTTGAKKYTCSCGDSYTEIVPTKAHTYKTTTTKATLTKNGKTVTKCSVCGDVQSTTTVYSPKTITLSKTAYTYNGKAQKPTVTVKDSKGNTLKNGTDYKVTYEKGRKNPGKYTVRIDFMGKYSGTKRVYFTIAPAVPVLAKTSQSTNAIRLTWNKVTGATGYRVYQYNSKTKKWDKLKTLKDTTYRIEKLKAGTTYKFRVKAYKKDGETIWGKATSTITVATKPATPKITKLTTTKAKATITWSNVSGESGYQVYYSTKKDSGFKKVATYKANVVKGSKSKLKSGKKYYFKVRAYKKTASGTVYSAWSAVKAVKIK